MKITKAIGTAVLFSTIVVLFVIGCSSLSDVVMGGATSGAEKAVSDRIEQAIYERLSPREDLPPPSSSNWGQFMANQAQIVFAYSFSAGGLWLGQTGYKPGEYTKFAWKAEDDTAVMIERAFLKKLEDGNEWWRVTWEEGEDTWIYEALLTPGENAEILRLRARDADGNEGDVPVTKGQTIYVPPAELTAESIEGATVERGKVSTPAGTFEADHVVYLAVTGEGEIEWWITEEVPGGVVKYLLNHKEEGVIWTSILQETGKNATTILSSF